MLETASAAQPDVTITLNSNNEKLGLELYDVVLAANNKPTVAIKSIRDQSKTRYLQPGMILPEFSSSLQVIERIQSGPYPIQIKFRNLAAGGDAISDMGTPIVSAADALRLASTSTPTNLARNSEYHMTIQRKPPSCVITSRRNDVLEINYVARLLSNGAVYDSSSSRGTGQPYQMVLGSGDMLPGVDQGLYDRCPGEQRILQIPPSLGYGARGNKLFKIPPDAAIEWTVELVSVNGQKEGDTRTRDEIEGRFAYS